MIYYMGKKNNKKRKKLNTKNIQQYIQLEKITKDYILRLHLKIFIVVFEILNKFNQFTIN